MRLLLFVTVRVMMFVWVDGMGPLGSHFAHKCKCKQPSLLFFQARSSLGMDPRISSLLYRTLLPTYTHYIVLFLMILIFSTLHWCSYLTWSATINYHSPTASPNFLTYTYTVVGVGCEARQSEISISFSEL